MSSYQEKAKEFLKKSSKKVAEKIEDFDPDLFIDNIVMKTGDLVDKAQDLTMEDVQKAGKTAVEKVKNFDPNDFNLDVPATIQKVLAIEANVIDREEFLQEAIGEYVSEESCRVAIEVSTVKAGIRRKLVDTIADQVISSEVNKASGLSVAAGSTWATLPADIVQYFGFVVRIAQKLAYLYGYPALDLKADEEALLASDDIGKLTRLIGVMFGAEEEAQKVSTKMGKLTMAKGVAAPVPIVGGVLSAGLTYATLRPNAERLKKTLSELYEANEQ